MIKRQKTLVILSLALLVLLVLGGVLYGGLRYISRSQQPLVRIHSPLRFEQVSLGGDALLHATARSSAGIERMELWVDGQLVSERVLPGGIYASPMVLTEPWVPTSLGRHEFIVRAFTPRGLTGQASVRIQAVEGSAPVPEDVLPAKGVSSEGAAGDGAASAPTGGSASEPGGSSVGSSGGEPPDPHGNPPGSFQGVFALMGFYRATGFGEDSPPPDQVRIEAHQLFTEADYERVFCYAGLAPMPPRWYPDDDGDQTTDEYFERLSPGEWDITSHLSGENGIMLASAGLSSITLHFRCVGITAGGTEAVELGSADPQIDQGGWDGTWRQVNSEGGEGSFRITYSVSPAGDPPGWVPIELDPDMAPPTNLRLEGAMLRWDYEPLPDEEPIDGFHVYIDDQLMFDVESDRRSTFIPSQALHPPCGEEYRFHLESFRGSDWSFPSNYAISASEAGNIECRRVRVTFNTLRTFDLGSDDSRDPGDVGPITGSFEANDEVARISGICDWCTWTDVGLRHNQEYALNGPNGLTTDANWLGTGPADWVIDVPPGESLYLGYQIIDNDRRGDWSYVCIGGIFLEDSEFAEPQEGVISSDVGQGQCEVSYSIQPVDVVSPDPLGVPPLPQLRVHEITLSASGDRPVIHFENVGTGDWAGQEIEVRVTTRDGESLGLYVYPEQFIHVGEVMGLVHPLLRPDRPLDICVELDPYNQVLERDEAIWHDQTYTRYCPPQPDLVVVAAAREYGTSHLRITIQNVGDGAVQGETLSVQLRTADGHYYPGTFPRLLENLLLDPWEVTGFDWDATGLIPPEVLDNGYSLIINPTHVIVESDESNDEYAVPANPELAFLMLGGDLRWYPLSGYDVCEPAEGYDSEPQTHVVTYTLQAWSAFGSRSLGSLTREYEVEGAGLNAFLAGGDERLQFELDGTEQLRVTVSGELHRGARTVDLGRGVFDPLTPEDDWGAHEVVGSLSDCDATGPIGGGPVYPPEPRQSQCGAWYFDYRICRLAN